MKIYYGSPSFLYCRLKQAYKDIYKNYIGLMPYDMFKEKIEKGKEIHFAGVIYQIQKQ